MFSGGREHTEKEPIVEKWQKLCLCCRLDAGKYRGAGGIVLLGREVSTGNFGLLKEDVDYPPVLVAMISLS